MNAAILCPGPSLAGWPAATFDPYELRIGVNRAALAHRCTAWAAIDWRGVDAREGHPDRAVNGGIEVWGPGVLGSPLLLTNESSRDALIKRAMPWRGEVVTTDSITSVVPHATGPLKGWTNLTVTCALIYVWQCGATSIDVYGMDWRGVRDFDHVIAGSDRTDDRWQNKEAPLWNRLAAELAQRGVTVERKQP